jgi:23S rRNA maturation mini-RNase III
MVGCWVTYSYLVRTHPSKASNSKITQTKEKQEKQTINKTQAKTLCKKDSWLQNDNHW